MPCPQVQVFEFVQSFSRIILSLGVRQAQDSRMHASFQYSSLHEYYINLLSKVNKHTKYFYLYIAAIPKLCVSRSYKREMQFMEACQSLNLNQLSTNQISASKYRTHARKRNYRDPCRLSFPQRACSQARYPFNYLTTVVRGKRRVIQSKHPIFIYKS